MKISSLITEMPTEKDLEAKPRPYVNYSIKFKHCFCVQERTKILESVGLNVFYFPAEMITGCDFLSDSGTTTMTNEQWASMFLADESYGSNEGYFILAEQIRKTFGEGFFNAPEANKPNAFLFHQGRSCENALFREVGKLGKDLLIPSNGHFDTTAANIEANKIKALNLFSKELKDFDSNYHFKGNMDVEKFEKVIMESKEKIPMAYLTITNNTGGGQPVSMENIRKVSEIAHKNSIPLFLDACRFAENAWFIKKFEEGYVDKEIKDIVKEMFTYADGFTISFKKDGLANMGGGLFIKDKGLFMEKYPGMADNLMNYQILTEGHPTYGGLSGRDIMTIAKGLEIVITEQYLDHRIEQVRFFGNLLKENNIPVLTPFGGHAVYIDMNRFFEGTGKKPEEYGGIAFTALLLGLYGHRACELGNFAFGKYNPETGKEEYPEVNYVRFALPRLRYEAEDLRSAALAVKALYDNRDKIPVVKVVYGKDLVLRHFKAKFELE